MRILELLAWMAVIALLGCDRKNTRGTQPRINPLISGGTNSAPATNTISGSVVTVEAEATASIKLGSNVESADLTQTHFDGDGECFPATVNGVECYQLVRKEKRPAAFFYVKIASHLKETPFTNAIIIVEYIDRVPHKSTAALTLEYDSTQGPYTRHAESVPLTGSNRWKQARFRLHDPLFKGRQNHGADFRVCALAPDLYVRSVTVLKNLTEEKRR